MQKNNSDILPRVFLTIILGTLAFGLLFNIFTGGGTMDSMGMGYSGGMMSGGSLDYFFGGLLNFLVKFLLVVLVIAVIIGIIVWIKKSFFKSTGDNGQFIKGLTNDPIVKTILVVAITIIGIILIASLFGGYGNGYNGMMGGYGGFNTTLSVAGILQLLVKVLAIVLVIALIIALAAYAKKLYDQSKTSSGEGANPNNQNQG